MSFKNPTSIVLADQSRSWSGIIISDLAVCQLIPCVSWNIQHQSFPSPHPTPQRVEKSYFIVRSECNIGCWSSAQGKIISSQAERNKLLGLQRAKTLTFCTKFVQFVPSLCCIHEKLHEIEIWISSFGHFYLFTQQKSNTNAPLFNIYYVGFQRLDKQLLPFKIFLTSSWIFSWYTDLLEVCAKNCIILY